MKAKRMEKNVWQVTKYVVEHCFVQSMYLSMHRHLFLSGNSRINQVIILDDAHRFLQACLVVDMSGGAPVLNERIKGCLLEDKQERFFFNREYLLQYHAVLLLLFSFGGVKKISLKQMVG